MIADDFEQFVELRDAQTLADVGFEQALTFADGQAVGAFEFDVLDREAAGVDRHHWLGWLNGFTRQCLEFFEPTLLLLEQALLILANQFLRTGIQFGSGLG
ncbi:hypothetical protein PS880_06246 [Pseudomonas fluorescens]|uniref:Uncharacterized protein n=1 Tax=Pseudomonas fluorescens TaxID=294 RepID=A0A5E7QHV0_PSEFL|nr:hypothetical protein PS880_06246 [Pseudomonas fluorescens]